jgi:hypothetical protein
MLSGTNYPYEVCPKVGHIVLFPAWQQHGVRSVRNNGTRITISFNLVLEEQPEDRCGEAPR